MEQEKPSFRLSNVRSVGKWPYMPMTREPVVVRAYRTGNVCVAINVRADDESVHEVRTIPQPWGHDLKIDGIQV